MAESPDGLAQSVQRQFDAGVPSETVVEELMGRGLSRSSAERFVARAQAGAAASEPSIPPEIAIPQGINRRRLAWAVVALIAALAVAWFIYSQQRRAAELARADRARADDIRAEASAYREGDNEERTAQLNAQVDAALARLRSDSPMTRCDAALQLGRIGTGAHINVLSDVVYDFSESSSVRVCAVSALQQMGETSTALGVYESWATDTDQTLRRAAITGFGDIGPAATDTALPFLERDLASDYMDLRYVVVETLGKLGPAADALLAEAAKDPNKLVRERAAALLKFRQKR